MFLPVPVYVCIVVLESQFCETIIRRLSRALMISVNSLQMHILYAENSFS